MHELYLVADEMVPVPQSSFESGPVLSSNPQPLPQSSVSPDSYQGAQPFKKILTSGAYVNVVIDDDSYEYELHDTEIVTGETYAAGIHSTRLHHYQFRTK